MTEKSIKFGKMYSLFYVILVGAIGSGLWDLFLKDFLYWAGNVFVNIASSFYEGYFDRLYQEVGRQIDIMLYLPGIALFVLIFLSPLLMFTYISIRFRKIELKFNRSNNESNGTYEISKAQKLLLEQFENHQLRFKLILIAPMFLASILFIDTFIVSTSSTKAVREVERRLEIIRPHISDITSYKLASDFRLIDNRQKLQNLVTAIDKIASDFNVILPELRLYGITSSKNSAN